jgi:hypothetical protein
VQISIIDVPAGRALAISGHSVFSAMSTMTSPERSLEGLENARTDGEPECMVRIFTRPARCQQTQAFGRKFQRPARSGKSNTNVDAMLRAHEFGLLSIADSGLRARAARLLRGETPP